MPEDTVAYLLLVLDLLVVAAILTVPVLLLLWLIGKVRPGSGAAHPSERPRERPARQRRPHGPEPTGRDRVLRRCNDCGTGWKGTPGHDLTVTGLKVRRWVRRRARGLKRSSPAWSRRQGWDRCPSCLSTDVRTSSRHTSDA